MPSPAADGREAVFHSYCNGNSGRNQAKPVRNGLTSLIAGPEELNGKGRLFSHIRLNPGSSIGYHVHEGDTELFYFLSGTGVYCDNGTDVKVGPGDVAICEAGHGHGVVNTGEGLLEMDADTDQPLPLLRLWFTLTTKEASADVTSVTFTTGGKDYTFSGLSDEGDFSRKEEGDYQQNMLIIFDDNSIPFLTELENNRLAGQETLKTVFHGNRDIEEELDRNFWDIFSVYWELYRNSNAPACLTDLAGTEMTAEPAA